MPLSDVIEIVSKKLERTSYSDDETKIKEAIAEAEYKIRSFCGRWQYEIDNFGVATLEELPLQLNYIWASIAIDLLILDANYNTSLSSNASSTDGIKSIKEGDTTIQFQDVSKSSSASVSSGIIDKYSNQLYPFRRLYSHLKD